MEEKENVTPEVVEVKGEEIKVENVQKPTDNGNFGWAILGFFIPLIGLILYCVYKEEGRPRDAKMAGMGALIGFIVNIVITIISSLFVSSLIDKIIEILQNSLTFIN